MSKLFTISLLLCLFLESCKDKSVSLDEIVKEIANYKMFEYKFVGANGDFSLQWTRYEQLLAKSSESELLHLCDNESPVVRGYAFQGLVEKKSSKVFDVLTNHIHDSGEFERTTGCMVDPCYVTDFYLEQVGYFPYDSSSYTITSQQRDFLDSLMLFGSEITLRMPTYNQIRLRSRYQMLKHVTPRNTYYNRLRQIVLDGVIEALPALAKFQQRNDVSIIKSIHENEGLIGEGFVIDAITNFPHPDLFFIVDQEVRNDLRHNNEFGNNLYKALVQYKIPKTRELLEEALSKFTVEKKEREINHVRFLVEKYPDQIFENLFSSQTSFP